MYECNLILWYEFTKLGTENYCANKKTETTDLEIYGNNWRNRIIPEIIIPVVSSIFIKISVIIIILDEASCQQRDHGRIFASYSGDKPPKL